MASKNYSSILFNIDIFRVVIVTYCSDFLSDESPNISWKQKETSAYNHPTITLLVFLKNLTIIFLFSFY